jgi:hypothetical protein
MEINNKHIVLIFIIIIVGIFIYNYDIYIISKNEPLCKPIYVTKREISPEIRAELNKTESNVLKETFKNIDTYYEGFGNLSDQDESSLNLDIPNKSFSSFSIPSITNPEKLKVIDSVIKILSYIPTTYCENDIKQLVEYFGMIYETSPNLETFYRNVASSIKIKEEPYNSKYSHLILFLIGKFDNDYAYCVNINNQLTNEQCAMNDLVNKINNSPNEEHTIIMPNLSNENIILPNEKVKKYNENNENNENNSMVNNKYPSSNEIINYMNNIKSNKIESNLREPNNNQNKYNEVSAQKENLILPNIRNKQQINNKVDIQTNNHQYKNSTHNPSCNGIKCSYKCDSSYMNAISYLDTELKPVESFGNISNNYAPFN